MSRACERFLWMVAICGVVLACSQDRDTLITYRGIADGRHLMHCRGYLTVFSQGNASSNIDLDCFEPGAGK